MTDEHGSSTGDPSDTFEYVGFWPRVGAQLIDTLLVCALSWPLVKLFAPQSLVLVDDNFFLAEWRRGFAYNLISYVLPAIAVIVFWLSRQRATPGKMVVSAKVVDARTGAALTTGQAIGRYLGYYVSAIPLCLGFIWVGIDSRKQGWHDKLAGTVVIRPKKRGAEAVRFDHKP